MTRIRRSKGALPVTEFFQPSDSVSCWEWTGNISPFGYGLWWSGKRRFQAHRAVYEAFVGKIPDGLTLDHLCRNRRCVNPSHLEPVTCRVNVLRGIGPTAKNAQKSTCSYGHPFEGNLLTRKDGWRDCRACHARRQREYRTRLAVRRQA